MVTDNCHLLIHSNQRAVKNCPGTFVKTCMYSSHLMNGFDKLKELNYKHYQKSIHKHLRYKQYNYIFFLSEEQFRSIWSVTDIHVLGLLAPYIW